MSPARFEARMDTLLSFPVGLFHPLQHAGLSRRTPSSRSGRRTVIRSGRPRVDLEVGFHGSRSLWNLQSQEGKHAQNRLSEVLQHPNVGVPHRFRPGEVAAVLRRCKKIRTASRSCSAQDANRAVQPYVKKPSL